MKKTLLFLALLTALAGMAWAGNTAHTNATYLNQARPIANVILCGEMDENGTIYFGPSTAQLGGNGADLSNGSTACDDLDNATEGTIDAPIATDTPFEVLGMYCVTDGTLAAGETIAFTARSAAADTTVVLTCSLAEAEVDCATSPGDRTQVAAGATLAVKVVMASNNSDDNAWCALTIAWGTAITPAARAPLP